MKNDVNDVAGHVVGQLAAQAISRVGPEPTREKRVEMLNRGFEIDTQGLSSQLKYTPDNHLGLVVLSPCSYDYTARQFKACGKYSYCQKYVK